MLTLDDVRRVTAETNQAQINAMMQRRNDYEQASQRFQADADMRPWFGAAVAYFTEQERITPNAPVQELYDRTVRHVRSLKGMGMQPPTPKRQPAPFLSHTGDAYTVPGMEFEQPQQRQGLSRESTEAKLQASQEYLRQRRMDKEARTFRDLSAEDIFKEFGASSTDRGVISRRGEDSIITR